MYEGHWFTHQKLYHLVNALISTEFVIKTIVLTKLPSI